ncbi:VOC family protein [Enterococcus saccharolyticus]|uniref:VOC domain-containing protein n=1 Tax=Candidatus Enterococcus willemsii TaxID=1857215 RepID=A0ABQ6Z0P7_9ENTE|nr:MULTISPECIES: CppA C-terminal domain-containing protein [Enterococcus]KAF1304577.1 hypothetical protein BAU17_10270 [Enterococcus sp. CU12B]MCD5001312.1 VOC family protein [Enterococcus saccharolyticus]
MSGFKLGKAAELATVAIRVKDRDKMIAFYRDLVGFELKGEENALAIMGTAKAKNEQLWLEESPRADDHFGQVKKMQSFTLSIPTVSELAAIYNRFKVADYPIENEAIAETITIHVIDPEENHVKFIALQANEVTTMEELAAMGNDENRYLSPEVHVRNVHLNVNDLSDEAAFLEGIVAISQDESQINEQFHVSLNESPSEAIAIDSHKIIGLEFLKFFVSEEKLLELEKLLNEQKKDFFIDKKKSILTIYDAIGVEWWFVRR